MGWTNSHLHQFAGGEGMYDPKAELYLMPTSIDEGMVGVDERKVRLDEVLGGAGERLWYEYDFGDGWLHTIDLEEVLPTDPGPRVASPANGPARRRTAAGSAGTRTFSKSSPDLPGASGRA